MPLDWVTSSSAGRARAGGDTRRYRSSKKAARNFLGSNRPCAASRASCCAREYRAGAIRHPPACSQPSPCEISWRRPSASHHKYVEVPPYHTRTYGTREQPHAASSGRRPGRPCHRRSGRRTSPIVASASNSLAARSIAAKQSVPARA